MTFYLQILTNGLLIGGVYILLGLGLNLIFGVMKIVNMAHGSIMLIGSLTTFWIYTIGKAHPVLGIIPSFLLTSALGYFLYDVAVGSRPKEEDVLVILYGVSVVVAYTFLFWLGSEFRAVQADWRSFRIGQVVVPAARALAFALSLVVSVAMYLVLRETRFGKAVRAVAQNPELAAACGINPKRVFRTTFALGCGLTGLTGSLIILLYAISAELSDVMSYVLRSFAIVVVGGLGNYAGTCLAGVLIGLTETVVGQFLGVQVIDLATYGVLLVILLVRPQGLLGSGRL